jgi:transcriptional regulator with PAS, ATPase and Fis domain
MNLFPWTQGLPGAITVSDADGIIIEMNDRSAEVFAEDGGKKLIGSSIFDCHPEPARSTLMELYKTRKKNIYTIEKNGVKKLIYQTPWYQEAEFAGFIELSLEIPFDMPHFIRD